MDQHGPAWTSMDLWHGRMRELEGSMTVAHGSRRSMLHLLASLPSCASVPPHLPLTYSPTSLPILRFTDLPFETTSGGKSAALGRRLLCSTNTPVCGSIHGEEEAVATAAAAFWASMCAWSSARKCAREEREWSALSTTRIWSPENLGVGRGGTMWGREERHMRGGREGPCV